MGWGVPAAQITEVKKWEQFVFQRLRKYNYLFLLVALTLQLVADPLFGEKAGSDTFRNVLSTVTLLVALFTVGVRNRHLALAVALGVFAIWGIWYVNWVEPNYVVAMISVLSRIAFSFFVIWLILTSLFKATRVTINTIFGSISVYMLLGFTFAVLYTYLEAFWPGSLYIDLARQPGGLLEYSDLVYFSFAVQTTLGFGDVTPVSPEARAFAALHAIVGVFYIAILIARFISMYVAETQSSRNSRRLQNEDPTHD